MSKYRPIVKYLQSIPAAKRELSMSFQDIEQALGFPLPPTAIVDRTWWGNARVSTHARQWLEAGWSVDSVDFSKRTVRFIRSDDVSKKTKATYGKLQVFLYSLPPMQTQLSLSFEELTEIIGNPLPKTAVGDQTWWANTKQFSPQGTAWLSAGWEVEKVYLRAKIVVFRRTGTNPIRAIPRYINSLLQRSDGVHTLSARMLMDWIRFCRRVGWYFQGTILYERGGTVDSLGESERAEIDEDYRVCKRALMIYKNVQM